MAGTVKKKRSPLRGKGGLIAVGIVVLLGIWYFIDLQRPVTDPNAPKAFEAVGAQAKDVTRVELKRPSGTVVLVKSGDDWNFEQPGRYPANPESVKSWLKGLLDDTDAKPVADKSADAAKYGLDKPQITVSLKTGGGTRTLQVGKEVLVGAGKKADLYFAREAGSGKVFTLPSGEVEGLRDKKIADLRDKRLMVLGEESEVEGITVQRGGKQIPLGTEADVSGTIHRGGQTIILDREAEDRWKMLEPFAAQASADDISTLINRLKTAEADSFVEDAAQDLAKYGLDEPRLTAQVTTKKGAQAVRFGTAKADGKVYAAREGSPAVMLLSKLGYEDIASQATPAKLRDRSLSALKADQITSFELRNKHGVVNLKKTGAEAWEFALEQDPKKKKASADKARQVTDRVTGEGTAHVEEAPKDLARYGLDKPQVTVSYTDGKSPNQVFSIGKKSKDGYYAKGAANAVFEVSSYVFDDLNLKQEAFRDPGK